jgi:hypothetical protein
LFISVHLLNAIIRGNGQAESCVANLVLVYRRGAAAVTKIGSAIAPKQQRVLLLDSLNRAVWLRHPNSYSNNYTNNFVGQ